MTDTETLRRVLLDHHPIMRSETGPLSGCRCGQVKLGQDVIAHVAAQLVAALASPAPAPQDGCTCDNVVPRKGSGRWG